MKYLIVIAIAVAISVVVLVVLLSQINEITMTREAERREPYLYQWQGPARPEPKEMLVIITAYNPTESQTDESPCISASGVDICQTDKKILACPREYEFGTIFEINGEEWDCQDRLSLKYDDRIDLLFKNVEEAKNYGKQELLVKIY